MLTVPFGIAALRNRASAGTVRLPYWRSACSARVPRYVLAANNVSRLGSTRASVTTYLIPAVALGLGVVLRDETVAVLSIIGSLAALLGAYLRTGRHEARRTSRDRRRCRRTLSRRAVARGPFGHAVGMTIFEHDINTLGGEPSSLAEYEGHPVLLVNVASRCGLTPQYTGLEQLQETYGPQGFSVLGFPCNQFGGQEPGSAEEIQSFCSTTYGVTFPMFEKIDVNGPGRHPIYAELTDVADADGHSGDIRWNFEKFLIDVDGSVSRFGPQVAPEDPAPGRRHRSGAGRLDRRWPDRERRRCRRLHRR